jgi:hypothetical protein
LYPSFRNAWASFWARRFLALGFVSAPCST